MPRLTMAQALLRYLAAQSTEVEGKTLPLFAGIFAIFGHGNVAGIGQALAELGERLPTFRAHNEQAMALAAVAFAKASNRRRMIACTSSIGPGATNMVTAAAVAHVNRLPCCCCRATSSPDGGPIRCCSRSRISPTPPSPPMTASDRSPATGIASRGPSSC
jgi:Acetolactate synthase